METKELLEKLGEQLAPLLFNIKPSVLIRVQTDMLPCGLSWHKAFCCKGCMSLEDLGITCHILKRSKAGSQILFYKNDLLETVLFNDKHHRFLDKQGYEGCTSAAEYLDVLRQKFNGNEFPHEIGIFLGYPFKDVVGFVTLGAQGYSATGLWRVFGHTEKSLNYMETIRKTKRHVAKLREQGVNLAEYFADLDSQGKRSVS